RRLMAFKYLGRIEIPVHVVDLDEIVRGEFAENVHRKSFLPSELDAIGQEISKLEAAYKQVQGQLNLDAKKNRPIVCPEGKFATMVCAPPWPIDKIRMEVNSDESEMDYETWTEEELPARLADLGRFIDSKAVDECVLWFWSTIRFQRIAEDAVEAWGWKRLPSGIWHKTTGMQPVGL